jgi:hypothetical protein
MVGLVLLRRTRGSFLVLSLVLKLSHPLFKAADSLKQSNDRFFVNLNRDGHAD